MSRPLLPPGTLLQHMYLKERLAPLPIGTFVEVGVGGGHISRLLLDSGWRGAGYDLSGEALARAAELLAPAIADGRMTLHEGNWLDAAGPTADMVISSMVIEHLDDADVRRYLDRCRESLNPGGRAMLLVPSSMRHWGIEDDIAGHLRRYDEAMLGATLEAAGWEVLHTSRLTFPLSNWLLPVSNALVARAESRKLTQSAQERTEASGRRDVAGKTTFHPVARMVLNEAAMAPFHWLQKAAGRHPSGLVLYAEARPKP